MKKLDTDVRTMMPIQIRPRILCVFVPLVERSR